MSAKSIRGAGGMSMPATWESQLRIVQSSARHLLAFINDLLDLARIAWGKVELLPEQL